jgi:hypothetical protein
VIIKSCIALCFVFEIINLGLFGFDAQLVVLHIQLYKLDLTTFEKILLEKGGKTKMVLIYKGK